MKTFKAVLCAVLLIAVAGASGWTQKTSNQDSSHNSDSGHAKPTALEQRVLKNWAKHDQDELDACTPQTCDDSGRFVLYRNLMGVYGQLGETNGANFKAAVKGYREMMKKHPEYMGHMPDETPSQKRERLAREKQQPVLAQKAMSFTPSDKSCSIVMGEGRDAVFLYQYRLEFYHLPPNMTVAGFRNTPKPPYYACFQILAHYNWKPFKTITFKHRIAEPSLADVRDTRFIWVCPDPMGDIYDGSTKEERAIIRQKYHDPYARMSWVNSSAEYGYFCGVISLDGKIIYRLPIKQHSPDTLFQFGAMGKNGESQEIKIGKLMTASDGEDGPESWVGDFYEYLIWTYPNHLQIFEKNNMPQLSEALKKGGLTWP